MVQGLSLIIWATLLTRHSPGSLSVFSFTVPIFGVVLSAWILSEEITARLIWGVIAVSIGIGVATHAGRRAALASGEGETSSHRHLDLGLRE
jgi:drug/metabolite transporter (DMT)-like permease